MTDEAVAAGEQIFATNCIACHGAKGEGNKALNAPKLTGLSDWYAVTQLKHFKSGVRGSHADDTYGKQMAPMSMTLAVLVGRERSSGASAISSKAPGG